MLNYVWLIPLLPLAGVSTNALLGRWLGRRLVAGIACLAVGASFVVSALAFAALLRLPAESAAGTNAREQIMPVFSWIVTGDLKVEAGLLVDQLSMTMALVVTGVSTLIHVYSAGYMRHEEYHHRYFTWLNLFVFMMLVLVMGDGFLTLFLGWEGVGLCSYLLIGFWFEREAAADAAKKAFMVNRAGDFGFLLAILLIFATVGSLSFGEVFSRASSIVPATATAISLLLFLGATAKSAQIPLYVWLPSAMEGPTPVSALIHAATMVTAGVYMVARCHLLFEQSASALAWVTWIGLLTALVAAAMAVVEKDMKRILAYSTISQLGLMFLGLGLGAYVSGLFQLVTHAFFKSLLFLGAGSVMHALAGETDIFRMGGLRRRLPWTFAAVSVGVLSISGVPLLAGFFSKDEILQMAFQRGGPFVGLLALFVAGLGAFYAFRLLFVAFCGKSRLAKRAEGQVHESPPVMLVPMVVLAVLSIVGGYAGLPKVLGLGSWLDEFLAPVFAGSKRIGLGESSAAAQWLVIGLSVLGTALGGALAWWAYVRNWGLAERWSQSAGWLYRLLHAKLYVDRAYEEGIARPLRRLAEALSGVVEARGLDGAVDGVAALLGLAGDGQRRLQTGLLRNYALAMLLGAAAVVGFLVLWSLHGS